MPLGDTAACPPNQFQCGSQECLELEQVCNEITNCADGSDEGGACLTRCAQQDFARCSHMCHSTPQGTVRSEASSLHVSRAVV